VLSPSPALLSVTLAVELSWLTITWAATKAESWRRRVECGMPLGLRPQLLGKMMSGVLFRDGRVRVVDASV
jgi:hypothetical protein